VLEVGCGTGLVYEALNQAIPSLSYVGLDYSKAMLDIAHWRYPDAMFRGGNAEALDYQDGWFDVAIAFEVFGHFQDFGKMVNELVRVAKKTAIFTMWLASGTKRLEGVDHYEHPYDSIQAAIRTATGGKGVVILEGLDPVAAFVIEKVQG
jgi:ubiquinone/menaquinone biosynthesis C-methylase UbiE